eukprot:4529604-Amphidinium_carterae.1
MRLFRALREEKQQSLLGRSAHSCPRSNAAVESWLLPVVRNLSKCHRPTFILAWSHEELAADLKVKCCHYPLEVQHQAEEVSDIRRKTRHPPKGGHGRNDVGNSLLCWLLFSSALECRLTAAAPKYQKEFEKASAAYEAQEWTKAIRHFQKSYELIPEDTVESLP